MGDSDSSPPRLANDQISRIINQLCLILRARGSRVAEAEEIAQDVFCYLTERRTLNRSFDDVQAIAAWLAVRRQCGLWRAKYLPRGDLSQKPIAREVMNGWRFDDHHGKADGSHEVETADLMECLPHKVQAVVALLYAGHSLRQAARRLKITREEAARRRNAARQILRRILDLA